MYQKRNKEFVILGLYLEDYTKEFYLREISKSTKIPLKTTQDVVSRLEKDNVIRSSTRGRNKYFRLNRNNIQTKLYMLQSEIHRTSVFLGRYPLFKTFLKDIKSDDPLVVFGSFANLTAGKESDLDILVISKKGSKLPFHLLPYKPHQISMSTNTFIKALGKQETLVKEISEKHVILNNHSFYVNVMWSHYAT